MSVIRQAAARLRGARHIEWVLLAAVLAALLLVTADAPGADLYESTSLERRMENVLSCIEGAGKVRVRVHSEDAAAAFAPQDGQAAGVLVVAEGAGNLRVNMELQRAVQALLGVEAEQIEILTMKEDDI